jgi:hypothetical protein
MNVVKQIGILFLTGLLFLKVVLIPILFINYEVRKDFITQNYCINKNRPELHCDGKCYLATQIKAVQQKEDNKAASETISKLFAFEIFYASSIPSNLLPFSEQIVGAEKHIYKSSKKGINFSLTIYQPPKSC